MYCGYFTQGPQQIIINFQQYLGHPFIVRDPRQALIIPFEQDTGPSQATLQHFCHLVLTAWQLPLIRLCGEMHCGSPGGVFPKITTQWSQLGLKFTLTIDALSIPLHILNVLFFFHHFFCFSEDKNQIVKRYVYSGTSGAASLQQFIEQNIYHRQGEVNFWELNQFCWAENVPLPKWDELS